MIRSFLRAFTFALLACLLTGLAFAAGYLYKEQQSAQARRPILDEAQQILETYGLEPLPAAPVLEYGMIRGMLQAYNEPYTVFVDPPQHELQGNALEGKYGGIGAQLEKDAAGYWSVYPFPDSPARRAGIQDGDRLLAVDSQEITPDTPADTVTSALRGPVGQAVALRLGRFPDYAPYEVSVERAEIPLPSTTWRIEPSEPRLGIVKVNLVAASSADEISKAMADLQQRGATHFVLDLRDNPGGLLTAGVDIARLFLKDGIVMQQQYRGREVEDYRVEKPGPFTDIPLVVLINQGSASAAEIAAGALQATGRAPLIGTRSYGKDSIQLLFTLQDGSSLHVTAARWWVPGLGGLIKGQGLQPDQPVDPATAAANVDPYLQAALQHFFKTK